MNPANFDLIKAVAAAQAEARTLNASEPGHDDPRERAWYYPPSEAVHAEVRRLCKRHGLAIILLAAQTGAKGQVCTNWRVTHLTTGQAMDVPWDTDPMPDLASKAHGISGAVRHAQRFMPLVLFSIPSRVRKRGEKVDASGAIVSEDHENRAAIVGGVVDDDIPWASVPADASDGTGGGLVDPLGGEDLDHDPAELAAEADAAACGEPPAPAPEVTGEALLSAVRQWGASAGVKGPKLFAEALRAAHDGDTTTDWARAPITGSEVALARHSRLVGFLREGGFLP